MKTTKQNVRSGRLTKAEKRSNTSNEKLEKARMEYQVVRAKLIEAIMADKADVLSSSQVEAAKKAFALWLKHVERMGKYWFANGNDFARFLAKVPAVDEPGLDAFGAPLAESR